MVGICQVIREEFRVKKIFLTPGKGEKIVGCQWNLPFCKWVYGLWRLVLFVYVLGWILALFVQGWRSSRSNKNETDSNINNDDNQTDNILARHFLLVYLTVWSYVVLGVYLVWAFWVYIAVMIRLQRASKWSLTDHTSASGDGTQKDASMTDINYANVSETSVENLMKMDLTGNTRWFEKVDWLLYEIISIIAPIITLVYFAMLYPAIKNAFPEYTVSVGDMNVHGLNTFIMLIDTLMRSLPVRLLHWVYPLAYGFIYVLFSIIYWATDKKNNVIYPVILDWNHPDLTILIVLALCFLVLPLFQFLVFLLYRLRIFFFQKRNV